MSQNGLENIQIHLGEYDSFAESAILYKNTLDQLPVTFLLFTLEDIARITGTSELNFKESLEKILSYIENIVPIISQNSRDLFILEPVSVFERKDFSSVSRSFEIQAHLNSYLIGLQDEYTNLKFAPVSNELLVARDPRFYYYGSMPFGPKTSQLISKCIYNIIINHIKPKAKVIVFDLDNTIWGGVIGEDGIEGIQVGDTFPGNIFRDIQTTLKRLNNYGVLLVAISKNTIEDAKLGLRHPLGIIKEKDLLALSASWEAKHESLTSILTDNNLSQNGLYFLDDSEIEREEMALSKINITILNQESSPVNLLQSLQNLESNLHHSITNEDIIRSDSYLSLKEANTTRKNFSSKEDFLASLQLRLLPRLLTSNNIQRAYQLINRTNQFNLTRLILSLNELEQRMHSNDYTYILFTLIDRYTNHGEVGLIGLHLDKYRIHIDHFLLSCRVLGRGIENSMFNYIIRLGKELSYENLNSYYEVNKNSEPASNFYSEAGMNLIGNSLQRIEFNANIKEYKEEAPKWIRMENIH
ncbi:HAD-IIIC family phosphatase [Prochlorococcus sp. MIT 1341]|uniref:HAD-IIIC family phosphatase n=1 Tax=Prochlorococcus sp. MIT 1341 TaxID=3096221 RepID=UPI002A74983C|nr:HAD-IIIC family phosphatase [Prochlorococcus sp. MIT 1341]